MIERKPHKNGADRETWTPNLLITSELLYQLSYVGIKWRSVRDSDPQGQLLPDCFQDSFLIQPDTLHYSTFISQLFIIVNT